MNTTLTELIGIDSGEIGSLSDLNAAINNEGGSVITNFRNHLSAIPYKDRKGIGAVGLDSNHVWEIVMYPLINDVLNGGFTYLPQIEYMNTLNKNGYGVQTGYGRWLRMSCGERVPVCRV